MFGCCYRIAIVVDIDDRKDPIFDAEEYFSRIFVMMYKIFNS